jgi:hypothetical protein
MHEGCREILSFIDPERGGFGGILPKSQSDGTIITEGLENMIYYTECY